MSEAAANIEEAFWLTRSQVHYTGKGGFGGLVEDVVVYKDFSPFQPVSARFSPFQSVLACFSSTPPAASTFTF